VLRKDTTTLVETLNIEHMEQLEVMKAELQEEYNKMELAQEALEGREQELDRIVVDYNGRMRECDSRESVMGFRETQVKVELENLRKSLETADANEKSVRLEIINLRQEHSLEITNIRNEWTLEVTQFNVTITQLTMNITMLQAEKSESVKSLELKVKEFTKSQRDLTELQEK
jgi:hypothetical protein